MSEDTQLDNITNYSYYIGVRSQGIGHDNAGEPVLDFFLEIPAAIKLRVKANEMLGELIPEDAEMKIAARISQEIGVIRIRARYCNDMITCLFHSTCQITRDEMGKLVKTIERKRLMESRCLL